MGVSINIEAHINIAADLRKLNKDDGFWKYAANSWHRLISPYTPMQKGILRDTVKIEPKVIEYLSPYAHYLYKGELMLDPETGSSYASKGAKKVYAGKNLDISKERNRLASTEWDKAAMPAQAPKLIGELQAYVDSGRLKLSD